MRVFLDCEFAALGSTVAPISFGLVDENQDAFYAEVNPLPTKSMSEWVQHNVVPKLWQKNPPPQMPPNTQYVTGSPFEISALMEGWLNERGTPENQITIWSDVYAWDWMLFCDLFGGMNTLPASVNYIPMDLATLLWANEIDPDISREALAGTPLEDKHHALHDAHTLRLCYERLVTP